MITRMDAVVNTEIAEINETGFFTLGDPGVICFGLVLGLFNLGKYRVIVNCRC